MLLLFIILLQSKRGQTSCPGCRTSFNNRYKPEFCDNCNYFLGGKYVPKEKKPKLNAPKSVKLFSKEGCSFFSAKTHSKDTRCIVIFDEENNLKQCLAGKCKEIRAAFVNSGKAEHFSCDHTVLCENPVPPIQEFSLTDDLISRYPCDKASKDDLYHLFQSKTGPHVFKVSSVSFCVNGIATASNSVGFCHVMNVNSKFLCSSKDCTRYASKTKASKHKKICMHVHVLLCIMQSSESSSVPSGSSDHDAVLGETSNLPATASATNQCVSIGETPNLPHPAVSSTSNQYAPTGETSNLPATASATNQCVPIGETPNLPAVASTSNQYASAGETPNLPVIASSSDQSSSSSNMVADYTNSDVHESSKDVEFLGRQSTIKLKMQKSLPYCIPQEILQRILLLDSKTILNGFGIDGWPSVYVPVEEMCSLCGASLSGARPHPGQKIGDGGFLITNAVIFEKVTILVKHCSKCKAMVQVFPYDLGKIFSLVMLLIVVCLPLIIFLVLILISL